MIQLLLESTRKIIETESLGKKMWNEYPDPLLLDAPINNLKAKGDVLCKWGLDKPITPPAYRLVCKRLSSGEHDQVYDGRMSAAATGHNMSARMSTWRLKTPLGAGVLNYQDNFISVLMISSVPFILSVEHQYASAMFTLDGLPHPMSRGTLFEPVGHGRISEINKVEYREKRVLFPRESVILKNAAERVRVGVPGKIQESHADFYRSAYQLLLRRNDPSPSRGH
ncbi:hypothetical protein EDD16DRAFT_1726470 [Pisolithus croceorrhizus]|nr:hypothetical protein EDD16DRAFT_1726470 [Pisolithus croceorrhizus]KAI6164394.1 hypothetical protein EDD17DRAFT_1506420 [Pisolithus thermaeus]